MHSAPLSYAPHPFSGFFSDPSTVIEGLPFSSDYNTSRPERPRIAVLEEKREENAVDIPQPPKLPHSRTLYDGLSMSPAAMFLSSFSAPSTSTMQAPLPDSEGQTIAGHTMGPIIGSGGFSTIRTAFDTVGGVVAVKIVRRTDIEKQDNAAQARKRLDQESEIWATLSHEHILPLFSVSRSSYADYFFTLFCPAGSLFDILKREGNPAMPQDDAGMMFRQVVRGLVYLHNVVGLVHRDIKLENVLVDEMGVCRIGDFGMARKVDLEEELEEAEDAFGLADEQQQKTSSPAAADLHRTASVVIPKRRTATHGLPIHLSLRRAGGRHRNSSPMSGTVTPSHPAHIFQPGSLPYAAPELLLPQTTAIRPNPAQDVWALAVLLYALLTGRLPFTDTFEPRLQMKILHGAYDIPKDIGHGAEEVLKGCLDRSTASRWTISMVDEVAWSVGWGPDVDDVTSPQVQEAVEAVTRRDSRSRSRCSSSRPRAAISPDGFADDNVDEWLQQEDSSHMPSRDAAQRRSTARAQRSFSRAPVLSRSPSISRPPIQSSSPSYGSFMRTLSSSSTLSSSNDSIALSLERGRRLRKAHTSRSRSNSPSMLPSTPLDTEHRYLRLEHETEEHEHSRGRRTFVRDINAFPTEELLEDDPDELLLLDPVAVEKPKLPPSSSLLQPDDEQERSRSFSTSAFHSYFEENNRYRHRPSPMIGLGLGIIMNSSSGSRRAGSTPPPRQKLPAATSSPAIVSSITFAEPSSPPGSDMRRMFVTSTGTRSRSVGCERERRGEYSICTTPYSG